MAKASKSADAQKKAFTLLTKAKATGDMKEVSPNLGEQNVDPTKSDDAPDEKTEGKPDGNPPKEVKSSDIIYKKPVRLHL